MLMYLGATMRCRKRCDRSIDFSKVNGFDMTPLDASQNLSKVAAAAAACRKAQKEPPAALYAAACRARGE